MHHFVLKDGGLHAESISLEALAEQVGTPTYVYSTATLTRHYGLLRDAVGQHRPALGNALIPVLTVIGLGLGKRHRSRVLANTPEVQGMIRAVQHLITVEKA